MSGWPAQARAGVRCRLGPHAAPPLSPGFAGTPGYLSPEVLRKEAYGKPVDIWACGETSVEAGVGPRGHLATVEGALRPCHLHRARPAPGLPPAGSPLPTQTRIANVTLALAEKPTTPVPCPSPRREVWARRMGGGCRPLWQGCLLGGGLRRS